MKKSIILLVMGVSAATALFSCGKGSSNAVNRTMTASINGSSFSVTNVFVYDTGGALNLIGATASAGNPAIQIVIPKYTGMGTYQIKNDSFSYGTTGFGALDSTTTSQSGAAYGTLLVTTANSTSISGTFSFTCLDSTKVTNGAFTAKVQ